jgi:tol-pal system protein YbgF
MLLRTHLSSVATLAFVLLGMAGLAQAGPQPAMVKNWSSAPSASHAPLVLAQAADPRVAGLEEEVRRLNGKLEELNFLLLQMQDQLQRMQEDNEFRFQQLEGGGSGAGTDGQRTEAPAAPADNSPSVAGVDPQQPLPGTGEPPRTLGNITFDQNGNMIGGEASPQLPMTDNSTVAALPSSSSSEETYRNAYEFLMSGDYRTAEAGFRDYLSRFPEGEQAADASFWLGDSMLQQGKHQEAAEVFLKANKEFPEAPKAPEMLLKLGVTLAAMKQKDIACATFDEVGTRYPQLSSVLKERVKREQASVGC